MWTDDYNRPDGALAVAGYKTDGLFSTTTPVITSLGVRGSATGVNDGTTLWRTMRSTTVQSVSVVWRSAATPYTNGRKYFDITLRGADTNNLIQVEFRIDTGIGGGATDISINDRVGGTWTQVNTTTPATGPVFTFPLTMTASVDSANLVTATVTDGTHTLTVTGTTSAGAGQYAGPSLYIDQIIESSSWTDIAPVIAQSAEVNWAQGSQGSAKTITLPYSVTVGDVVAVEVAYSASIISSVSGLGGTWSVIRSREGSSNPFSAAEIWYCTVATTGTTITITPNSGFTINSGHATAREYAGLSGTASVQSVVSSQSFGNTVTTPAAAASAKYKVWVGALVINRSEAPSSITASPGAMTAQTSTTTGDSYAVSGARIAAGAESPSLSATWAVGGYGLGVAAIFDAIGDASTTAARLAREAVTVAVDTTDPAPRLAREAVTVALDPPTPATRLARQTVSVAIKSAGFIKVQRGWGTPIGPGV